MVIWPKAFVTGSSNDSLEDRFGRLSMAVCLYIVMGYVLVVLQLYEVIAVCLVLLLLSTRRLWKRGGAEERDRVVTAYSVWFYEVAEIGFRIKSKWRQWRGTLTMIRKDIRLRSAVKGEPLHFILLGGILSISAYIRFYDATHHAPPALSDGVVTLAWMKYINNRILFHDDLYPQGFAIILSLLSKFAAIDELYILKYTGPLCGVLTALGLYFCLSRFTGNKTAGLIGAAMFGFGGMFMFGSDWERQAATNSQEFSMVFAFPSLYFILRYLESGQRRNLWNGIAACAVTGFVHTMLLGYVGVGIGVAVMAAILVPETRSWRRIGIVCACAAGAAIVTYMPIQIGHWAGIKFNSSAEQFLLSKTDVRYPLLQIRDYAAFAALGIVVVSSIIRWRDRSRRLIEWFTVGFGSASFLLYYWVPVFTQSTMLSSRTSILWAMYICYVIGFAWWSIWRFVPLWKGVRTVQILLGAAVLASFVVYVQIKPIETYKMQWESATRAYLKIASMQLPMTWTIFSNSQDYALVYGNGWHQYLRTLIDEYDPTGTPITRVGQDEYDPDVTPWMYVIQQKNIFKVNESNSVYQAMEKTYEQEEKDNRDLEAWFKKYEPVHGRPPVVYEDENIKVYLIERPDASDKRIRRLWGVSS